MKHALAISFAAFAWSAWANTAHDMIAAMDEPARKSFFGKYLATNGEPCPAATRTFYQGSDKSGNAFWSIGCNNGSAYSLMVFNNATGSARVLDCKVLIAVKAPACFTKFK